MFLLWLISKSNDPTLKILSYTTLQKHVDLLKMDANFPNMFHATQLNPYPDIITIYSHVSCNIHGFLVQRGNEIAYF